MFRFSFSHEQEDELNEAENLNKFETPAEAPLAVSKKLEFKHFHIDLADKLNENECNSVTVGDVNLVYVPVNVALNNFKGDIEGTIIAEADSKSSDLIPGKYEGGLKVWECTFDLLNYLSNLDKNLFSNKRVLDLGCGSGLLGVLALKKGASVVFQDFNFDVLELITITNVIKNLKIKSVDDSRLFEFYSGDWTNFLTQLEVETENEEANTPGDAQRKKRRLETSNPCYQQFDVILTSETIYNPNNYVKIFNILSNCLTVDGVGYVSAKTHYFGVGGSTRDFQDFVNRNGTLTTCVCCTFHEGVKREILEVKRNPVDVKK